MDLPVQNIVNTPETGVEQPVLPTYSEPKSSQPSKLPLIIFTILTLIFVSVSTYYFSRFNKNNFPTPSPTDIPSPTPDNSNDLSTWQTYTNKALGFELKYPPTVQITHEFNDENNRATEFAGGDLQFSVMLRAKGNIDFSKYYFMDTPIDSLSSLDVQKANVYLNQASDNCVSENGPACPKSFVTYAALRGNDIYHLSFFGDKELSQTESYILGSFKFITPVKLNTNVKTYTSTDLGVSFSYLAKYESGETISVKEVGNRIYVYSNYLKPESGQYVEVFNKDPNDSLNDAITKTILAGYSTSDCLITDMKNISGGEEVEVSTYKFARLDVPRGGEVNMEELGAKFAKCPTPYASYGGMTGFLMDPAHSSKFAFFSIGQYALTGDTDKNTWQDTFKFIN